MRRNHFYTWGLLLGVLFLHSPLKANQRSIEACFNNVEKFLQPYIYHWQDDGVDDLANTPWPGTPLTEKDGIFCKTFSTSSQSINVIFSDNGNSQTQDLKISESLCYSSGQWISIQACKDLNAPRKKIDAIYFKNTMAYDAPYLYYFNTSPQIPSVNWPGQAMEALGNNLFVYKFSTAQESVQIVLSDAGQNQSQDLNPDPDTPCFDNGDWKPLSECKVSSRIEFDVLGETTINQGSRAPFVAKVNLDSEYEVRWTSNAFTETLVGQTVALPSIEQKGSYQLIATVTDEFDNQGQAVIDFRVVQPSKRFYNRPELTQNLNFPLDELSSSEYKFERAFPNLTGLFQAPVMILPDGMNDLLYVVDKPGLVHVFPNNPDVAREDVVTLLDIKDIVRDFHEQGLLSIAFDPEFSNNGLFYAYYIEGSNDNISDDGKFGDAVLAAWKMSNPKNPLTTQVNKHHELLRIPQPGADHKGGMMMFHPEDKYLYLGVGDGAYGHSAKKLLFQRTLGQTIALKKPITFWVPLSESSH